MTIADQILAAVAGRETFRRAELFDRIEASENGIDIALAKLVEAGRPAGAHRAGAGTRAGGVTHGRADGAPRRPGRAAVAGRGGDAAAVRGPDAASGGLTMATGSQAAARERLQAARYRTGRAQFETRCDTCAHCTAAAGGKQHGRYCEAHRAGVKTHGICDRWNWAEMPRGPR